MSIGPYREPERILPLKSVFQCYAEGQDLEISVVVSDARFQASRPEVIKQSRMPEELIAVRRIELLSNDVDSNIGALRRDPELADDLSALILVDRAFRVGEITELNFGRRNVEIRAALAKRLLEIGNRKSLDSVIAWRYIRGEFSKEQSLGRELLEAYEDKATWPEVTSFVDIEKYPRNKSLDEFVTFVKDELLPPEISGLKRKYLEYIAILNNLDPIAVLRPGFGVVERSKDYNNLLYYLGFVLFEHTRGISTEEDLRKQLHSIESLQKFCEDTPSFDRYVFERARYEANRLIETHNRVYMGYVLLVIQDAFQQTDVMEKYLTPSEFRGRDKLATASFEDKMLVMPKR